MPLDLLGTLIVGVAAGGLIWLVFRTRRRRAPRFLIPLVTGGSMLAYAIWNEYSWASRAVDALPPGFEVIERIPQRAIWQPWTYAVPRTGRLIVLDRAQLRRNERYPGHVLVDLVLLERLLPARRVLIMLDCVNARQVDVTDAALLTFEGGLPPETAWSAVRQDGRLFQAACGATGGSGSLPPS